MRPRLQRPQQLPRLDAITFPRKQRRDALAVVERELHLADVDIAIEKQTVVGSRAGPVVPKPKTGCDGSED